MPKQIQVSDELHTRLKGAADAHGRKIGAEIEFMMDLIGGRNNARESVQYSYTPDSRKMPEDIFNPSLKETKVVETEDWGA